MKNECYELLLKLKSQIDETIEKLDLEKQFEHLKKVNYVYYLNMTDLPETIGGHNIVRNGLKEMWVFPGFNPCIRITFVDGQKGLWQGFESYEKAIDFLNDRRS